MAKGINNASNKKSSSSKPYDANNSFVKKVASRVTGLIPQRSWLSGWFSTTNEVSDTADETQSERFNQDNAEPEDHLDQPPPSKRIKLPDRNYESELFTPSEIKEVKKTCEGDFLDMSSVPGPSGQQRGSSGFVASTPAEERKANGDDCSESAESTSGCSSLEPQMNRGPGLVGPQARPSEALPSRFLDDRFNYPSYLQSPRSLFLDRSSTSRSNQSARSRKPSFSVTSLNSSLFGDRSLNETMVNSPFYSGRTMYGGASSSPYRRSVGSASFTSPSGSDKAGRCNVTVKPSPAQSKPDTGMSETARRILATLEQFSTPLLDAKRIPVTSNPEPVLASTSRKRPRQETEEPRMLLNPARSPQLTRKGVHWAKGPPVQQLSVPRTPDMLLVHRKERFSSATEEALVRQKERLQDSTTAARRLANSVPATNIGLERSYTLRCDDDEPASSKPQSLKMRSQRTKVHQSLDDKRNSAPAEVNLPKVALPITSLPSFDIPVVKPPASAPTSVPKVPVMRSPASPVVTASLSPKAAPKTPSAPFTFASPIVVASEHKPISPVAFVFSKPDPVSEESVSPSTGLNFLSSVPSLSDKSGLKRKSVTVNENGSDASVFSLKPPSELRTGSVMDILGKGTKDTKEVNGSVSLMDKFKPAAGTWECDQCMIRNKAELSRCAACTNPRPAAGGKAASNAAAVAPPEPPKVSSSATKSDNSFGAQFKLAGSDMWECSACMVRNKSGSSECVACGAGKPGAAPAKPPPTPAASGWGDKFKPASNTWECEACMVRNASELTACQACTTKRPGAAPVVSATPTSASNTAALTTSSWGDKFKKAEGSWDCSDCMITNKSASLKCVACGAKKPGSEGVEAAAPAETPKFSFGIPPASTGAAAVSGFTFGVKPTEKTEEKPASTSGFKFGSSDSSASTTGFSFGIPAAAPASSSSTSSPGSSAITTTTITTAAASPTVTSAITSEKPAFSFGVPKPTTETTSKPESLTQVKVATFSFGQSASEKSEPSRKRKSSAESTTCSSTDLPKLPAPSPIFSASGAKDTSTVTPTTSKTNESTPPKPTPVFSFSSSQAASTNSPASLFKFGADSNTSAASSPKSAPSASAEETKPSQEVKPFFGASSTPALNSTSTFSFGQSSSEAPKPVLPAFGASADASAPKPTFSFGQTSSETKPADAPAKPTFAFGQSTTEPAKPAEAPKPSVTFGSAAKEASEKPPFNFQPVTDSTPKPLSAFGSHSGTSTTPLFGSSGAFPAFGSSGSSAASVPAFGSTASVNPTAPANPASTPAPAAPTSVFRAASNAAPTFGSSFGSTEKTETKASGMFTFGAATNKPAAAAAAPFTCGASTPAANGPTFGAQTWAPKPYSAYLPPPANSAPSPTPGFNFGASAPTPSPAFGAQPTNTPIFGSNNIPSFGAPAQPTFNAPTPTFGAPSANAAPGLSSSFNFSANSTPTPGVFTFGGPQPSQNSTPSPFSFTAKPAQAPPTFNPNATPNFNFTAGGTVNFTATPGDGKPMPQRVIKKAMRRTQPR